MKTSSSSASPTQLHPKPHADFEDLFCLENKALDEAGISSSSQPEHTSENNTVQTPWRIMPPDHIEEPWVAFTTRDRVGLALSGGGIRSATFNLGILQALKQNQVLNRVSYLSTVSGGGYIGGFWTRWWHAYKEKNPQDTIHQKDFPPVPGSADGALPSGPKEIREIPEFRHLREFSRFLIPRRGLNTEFWGAASTILTGLVPSLLAAMAAVLLVMTIWVFCAAGMLQPQIWATGIFFAETILILLFFTEVTTNQTGRFAVTESIRNNFNKWYAFWSLLATAAVLILWVNWVAAGGPKGETLCLNPRIFSKGVQHYVFNGSIFRPTKTLLAVLAVLTIVRLVWGRFNRMTSPSKSTADPRDNATTASPIAASAALERVMARVLAIIVIWAALAGTWELARWLVVQAGAHGFIGIDPTSGVSGMTAVLALLFYWVRHWLGQSKKDSADLKFLDRLKPLVPQILANGVVFLMLVLAAVYILGDLKDSPLPGLWIPGVCIVVLIIVLLLFDPAKFGLHEFYRSRLTRCYLGACQNASSDNRMPVECPDDDMRLSEDSGRPLHLICCAANHFWGDPLSTLHRGARSAVLSRFGISLGDYWIADEELHLSAALTASAAAFNSLMGELNLQVGRAVSFVMTALNLRLGLWVSNPSHSHHSPPQKVKFPGMFFIKEMLGWAQCRTDKHAGAYIHLSDGGHFENLALYELIRRHCRYVIVSDAGEDRDFEFTDFGRAVRRVREDFGVEIEIDLTSLKPKADAMAEQHIAVGVIHYDGLAGTDKGTILYFKPTLTGDEPVDLLQYHRRKPHFPHESTGDQFFDEAQFESYRRLGEHTANISLQVLERLIDNGKDLADETLFRKIRLHWYRVPWMQGEAGIRLCDHAADLESVLRDQASATMRREFFADIHAANARTPDGPPVVETVAVTNGIAGEVNSGLPVDDHTAAVAAAGDRSDIDLLLAIRAFKFMEEAWVVCDLERYLSHPLAQSWMSYIHRWAAMPTIRKWWPVLRTLFGSDFQTFADTDLGLAPVQSGAASQPTRFELLEDPAIDRHGFARRRLEQCHPGFDFADATPFSLDLKFFSEGDSSSLSLQVGLAFVTIDFPKGVASWTIDDLFVPPELLGGGFHSRLLDLLIHHFKFDYGPERAIHRLEVTLADASSITVTRPRLNPAGRQERVERIDFYRSRQFRFDGVDWSKEGENNRMVLVLRKT